ncbi:MAG TPA: hypothetical protein ENH84_00645 [Phycisphaerae bacterium]|nr:hypothetical protein [Phycisphaerae bacterium]
MKTIQKNLAAGDATENTHRPALKTFLESIARKITATNEPKHQPCGAPDFVVKRRGRILGYIECKDAGVNLDEVEKTEQLKRYFRSLGNLILTDYLEFRWYVDGTRRAEACLGKVDRMGKAKPLADGPTKVEQLLSDFLAHKPLPISRPKDLAIRMSRLTHMIRDIVIDTFVNNEASDLLKSLREALAKVLIPDIAQEEKTDEFADMFAQTLAYGLFAAACNHPGGKPFHRLGAAAEIPKTNPFLRHLFETITGADLNDEPYAPCWMMPTFTRFWPTSVSARRNRTRSSISTKPSWQNTILPSGRREECTTRPNRWSVTSFAPLIACSRNTSTVPTDWPTKRPLLTGDKANPTKTESAPPLPRPPRAS